jgi:SAM-dependent methyltransferase
VFAQLGLEPEMRVLEVGCGPGNLWRANAAALPDGVELTLVDSSPGMLREARERLQSANVRARFAEMDAQRLDLPSESFDLVVANHMLYHVPDRSAALAEFRRVLRPGGRVVVGTNGAEHLREVGALIERFAVLEWLGRDSLASGFDLDAALREVSGHFASVELRRRDDTLRVTAAEPLIAWIRSALPADRCDSAELRALGEWLRGEIERRGEFRVSVCAGVALGVRARLAP